MKKGFNIMYLGKNIFHIVSIVDEVSLSESEYIVEEGSGEVVISITRSGNLLDNITTLFVATEIPEIANSARGNTHLIYQHN